MDVMVSSVSMFSPLILVLTVLAAVLPTAHAQSVFDKATECDVLAAHPADPSRVAPGVNPEEIISALAIEACETALANDKDTARYALQLGRAWLQSGDTATALTYFRDAANNGSGVALVYLGDAAQFGWTGAADSDKARSFYKEAIQGGVNAAQMALDQLTFDPANFAVGPFLEHLVEQRVSAAADLAKDARARAYLFTFTMELQAACGNILKPDAVSALYIMRYPPDWSAQEDEQDFAIGVQDFVASYDATAFFEQHGCDGMLVGNLIGTLNNVLRFLAKDIQ